MDDLPRRVEHTVLGPQTRWADVRSVLDAADDLGMRACIPPCYVSSAIEYAPDVPLVTVVDFPHGQGAIQPTIAAAQTAVADGADELDLVANVGALTDGNDDFVGQKIAAVADVVQCPVKVIVEAPLLSEGEKRRIAEIATEAGADFLKTATGFSEGGATVEDVELLSEYLPVKASGGIGSWEEAEAMLEAGAQRIGASSGDVIVREWLEGTD